MCNSSDRCGIPASLTYIYLYIYIYTPYDPCNPYITLHNLLLPVVSVLFSIIPILRPYNPYYNPYVFPSFHFIFHVLFPFDSPLLILIRSQHYMGGCQHYGPFLGTLNNRGRTIMGTQKGTIILTTTHISSQAQTLLACPARRTAEDPGAAPCALNVQAAALLNIRIIWGLY